MEMIWEHTGVAVAKQGFKKNAVLPFRDCGLKIDLEKGALNI